MRKPNYSMERKDRERAKQAKAAAKVEKRTAKGVEPPEETPTAARDNLDRRDLEKAKPDG